MNVALNDNKRKHNPKLYWTLTVRHFKMFFKNKLMFFFALLVPLITIAIYIIFLRELEVNAINNGIKEVYKDIIGRNPSDGVYNRVYLMADAWMLSGVLAVSCISVSLNTCSIMVEDKERGVNRDFISSPISRNAVNVSYFLFNILATLLVTFFVMLFTFIYLLATGGAQISFTNLLLILITLIISTISASLVTCFVASFIKTNAVFSSVVAIASTATGFLTGSFMPTTMLPKVAQKVTLFFPGTYSAGLFRTYYLTDYYNNFEAYLIKPISQGGEGLSAEQIAKIKEKISDSFSMNIDFFGRQLNTGYMVLAIVIFFVLFLMLNVVFIDRNFKKSIIGKFKRKK